MSAHILWTPTFTRPWFPTTKRSRETWGKKIWTDCCGCKVPSEETDCRLVTYYEHPLGGLGGETTFTGKFTPFDIPTGAYYDPTWEVRCAEGKGCTVNPRKKNGRALREIWRFG